MSFSQEGKKLKKTVCDHGQDGKGNTGLGEVQLIYEAQKARWKSRYVATLKYIDHVNKENWWICRNQSFSIEKWVN